MQKCRIFEVWSLNDGINWASLLAEATENALGHIDVVLGSSSGAIGSWLRFDGDSESWASSFTELTGDASLLASWVSSEGVLTSEHGRESSLFPRVVDDVVGFEGGPGGHEEWWPG